MLYRDDVSETGRQQFLVNVFNRPASFLPASKTALDMGDRFQAHILGGLRRQRRSPVEGAMKDKTLVLAEDRLEVWAFWINPKFQHTARAMHTPGDLALSLQLANIADINDRNVVPAV